MLERLDKLASAVESLVTLMSEKREEKTEKLEWLEEKYGMNSHGDNAAETQKFTESDVEKIKF